MTKDGLQSLNLRSEYRTGEQDLIAGFYKPCLDTATTYDRAVGYFRSTILLLAGDSFLAFARRGGQARVVCSPDLTPEDLDALQRGYRSRDEVLAKALNCEIDRLLAEVNTRDATEALAALVAVGAIDMRIAYRSTGGIFHEKLGVFSDGANIVSFKGSINETWEGWSALGNHESFEVFCSWLQNDSERVNRHRKYFDRLWTGDVIGVEVSSLPEATIKHLRCAAATSRTPQPPNPSSARRLLPHQQTALATWVALGRRGILEHATGSGKTITALNAVRDHITEGLPALIVVPSELLLQQWQREIRREIPAAKVLLVGGGNDAWRKRGRVEAFTTADPTYGPRVVLGLLQSLYNNEFRERVRSGADLLMVADEVHRCGSTEFSALFEIESGPRLGLSATPRRYGDPAGTARIFTYFGDIVPPSVTLKDAIDAGRLVPYVYRPHAVTLTATEIDAWDELTTRIRREAARSKGRDRETMSPQLRHLLIRRARIAKTAEAKLDLARSIIRDDYSAGDRWIIYCDDATQMKDVRRIVAGQGVPNYEYFAAMTEDPEATLKWFVRDGGVLVAIRCLDEGVDIPSVTHALILASSQNPREFIQRRGRVLRIAPDKRRATIHDALVLPPRNDNSVDSLHGSEIARAAQFARDALNVTAQTELLNLCYRFGIDQSIAEQGFEYDDGEE